MGCTAPNPAVWTHPTACAVLVYAVATGLGRCAVVLYAVAAERAPCVVPARHTPQAVGTDSAVLNMVRSRIFEEECAVPTLVPGQIVEEKYKVVRALAAGGFGAVYEVFREGLKQRGAMKVLTLNPSKEMVQRIHNEAHVLGALRHPNIPQIYDMGRFPDGAPWLVMEFLEGESLEARLIRALKSGQRGLPFADVMEIGEDITAAMNAAHEKGVVHRDMKPSNVMLVPDAKAACGLRAMVLDFGIARMAGDGLTQTGALLGTPAYMAPEQAVDARQADAQSDVYAVGMVLYQSLCGRPPFDIDPARGPYGVLLAKAMPPEPLALHAPHVPADIQMLIMRTLEREPTQRPSMGDLEEALGRHRPPRRTGKTASSHVVSVNPPAGRRTPDEEEEDDPTSSVSEAVAALPSLSGSLLPSETPSEQRVRGEISPGRDALPVVVPQSISDVPSRPMALPPLKASPEDRTAQPAPTQGVPAALASPAEKTAAPDLDVQTGGMDPPAMSAPRGAIVALAGVAALLSVALTGAVWSWYRPAKPPVAASGLDSLRGGDVPVGPTESTATQTARPADAQAATRSELEPAKAPSAPSAVAASAVAAPKKEDPAAKPQTRPRECEPVPPTESCTITPSMTNEQRSLLISAIVRSGVRWCPSETFALSGLPDSPSLSSAPRSLPENEHRPMLLTIRGLLRGHAIPSRAKIQCRPR